MPLMRHNFKIIRHALKVKSKKNSNRFTFNFSLFALRLLLIFCFLLFSYSLSVAAEITGPEVRFKDNEIFVTTSLSLDEKYIDELKNGIDKQYIFYIDVFRVWNVWPDEFILGKTITKTLKCDPVKSEYIATSGDGSILIKKRFKSFGPMLKWAVSIENLRLANTQEFKPGKYYVRVTVESKIRKLPPVIGYFLIFLPENEFKIKKDSSFFTIGQSAK
jgi:hypothetical protein